MTAADPRFFAAARPDGVIASFWSSADYFRSSPGNRHRSLFTAGALAVIRYAKIHSNDHRPWLTRLLARRSTKVAAIALANKLASMAYDGQERTLQ